MTGLIDSRENPRFDIWKFRLKVAYLLCFVFRFEDVIVFATSHYVHNKAIAKEHKASYKLPCHATAQTHKTNQPELHTSHLPYSRLGTMTGPYFIGALYPPSF